MPERTPTLYSKMSQSEPIPPVTPCGGLADNDYILSSFWPLWGKQERRKDFSTAWLANYIIALIWGERPILEFLSKQTGQRQLYMNYRYR